MAKPANLKGKLEQVITDALGAKLPLTVLIFTEYNEGSSYTTIVGIFQNISDEELIAKAKSYVYVNLHRRLPLSKFNLDRYGELKPRQIIEFEDGYGGYGWGHYFSIEECHTAEKLIRTILK